MVFCVIFPTCQVFWKSVTVLAHDVLFPCMLDIFDCALLFLYLCVCVKPYMKDFPLAMIFSSNFSPARGLRHFQSMTTFNQTLNLNFELHCFQSYTYGYSSQGKPPSDSALRFHFGNFLKIFHRRHLWSRIISNSLLYWRYRTWVPRNILKVSQ